MATSIATYLGDITPLDIAKPLASSEFNDKEFDIGVMFILDASAPVSNA